MGAQGAAAVGGYLRKWCPHSQPHPRVLETAYLAGTAEPGGAELENLVLLDLVAWRDARLDRVDVCYWRTAAGEEVDFVIDAGGQLLPVEIKATSRPRMADASSLRSFRSEYGKKARAGLLLHTGSRLDWIAPDVLAAPWWRVV